MAHDGTGHSPAGDAPGDPIGTDRPHDVLAAEEFAMPTRAAGPPRDPTGIQQPHDVLAAEEFAMPVGGLGPTPASGAAGAGWIRLIATLALAALVAALVARRR